MGLPSFPHHMESVFDLLHSSLGEPQLTRQQADLVLDTSFRDWFRFRTECLAGRTPDPCVRCNVFSHSTRFRRCCAKKPHVYAEIRFQHLENCNNAYYWRILQNHVRRTLYELI